MELRKFFAIIPFFYIQNPLISNKMNNQSDNQDHTPSLWWQNKYKCPICHNVHPVEDCEIEERFISSKHTGSTIQGRYAVHKFVDTYRYVRVCHKCAKKQRKTRKIIKIIMYIVIPILFLVRGIINSWDKFDGYEFLGMLVFMGIFYFFASIINAIINRILDNSVFEIDYEQAYHDNALSTKSEYDEQNK